MPTPVLLSKTEEDNVYELLRERPAENAMLLGVLYESGITQTQRMFYGIEEAGRLCGILSLGRDIALAGDPSSMPDLATFALTLSPLCRRIVSPECLVSPFWKNYQHCGEAIQFDRLQTLYELLPSQLSSLSHPQLRLAKHTELELLVGSSAAMQQEELGTDPRQSDPIGYRLRIQHLIERGRLYCVVDAEGVVFQAAINSESPEACQISSVYTRPDKRGKGFARRALASLCAQRLRQSARCCLFVNDTNLSAIAAYEAIGFQAIGKFRSIFLQDRP